MERNLFSAIGKFVYKFKFLVVAIFVIGLLGLGGYGFNVSKDMSSTGYFDAQSDSVKGADLATAAYERDASSDLLLMMYAPEGKTLTDAEVEKTVTDQLNNFAVAYPDEINQVFSYWNTPEATKNKMITPDHKIGFASIWLNGEEGTEIINNYENVKDKLTIPGIKTELAGQIAVNGSVNTATDNDTTRAELIALPLVALMLFVIFGGVIAASLPVIIGGLTIAGSLGIMKFLTHLMDVNQFTRPVITMIGLGIAIDYGLFIVSRFREEIAEKQPTRTAVRNTVMTAARTVVFSAIIIIGSLCSLLFFPQPFLHSVAIGAIIAVGLAALCSLFVLPAILAILGKNIDKWGFKFLRRTKSKTEIENGFWGKLASLVMRNPRKIAATVIILLVALVLPTANLKLGGIDEKLLPPSNPTRQAMENFNNNFPEWRIQTLKVVLENATDQQAADVKKQINAIPGFSTPFETNGLLVKKDPGKNVKIYSAGLIDPNTDSEAVKALRSIPAPPGTHLYIAGDPALQVDSLQALKDNALKAIVFLLCVTFVLMFLAFGSFVLPLKAMLVSILGLGATLGILTLIFTDGHGQKVLDFTPGPLMAPVLMLIIAILYGLSTDYEVLLMSRMLEARAQGHSTEESVRLGTAYTGRIITAAAAILIVVTGAFGFSEIVIMKYIAFGMIFALLLDATIIRMLLVPAIMKLLGNDSWWAPAWLVKIQHKLGLGEVSIAEETTSAVKAYQEQNNRITKLKAAEPVETPASSTPDLNLYQDELAEEVSKSYLAPEAELPDSTSTNLQVVPPVSELTNPSGKFFDVLLNNNEYLEEPIVPPAPKKVKEAEIVEFPTKKVTEKTPEAEKTPKKSTTSKTSANKTAPSKPSAPKATGSKAANTTKTEEKKPATETEKKSPAAKKPTTAKKPATEKKSTGEKKTSKPKTTSTASTTSSKPKTSSAKASAPKTVTNGKAATTSKSSSPSNSKATIPKTETDQQGKHAERQQGISAAELLKRERERRNKK